MEETNSDVRSVGFVPSGYRVPGNNLRLVEIRPGGYIYLGAYDKELDFFTGEPVLIDRDPPQD